jgi:uncharacterized protein YndB with AHSA1/START domain
MAPGEVLVFRPEACMVMPCGREQVWAVLADGWLYPLWVVGATHMRAVDEGWPQVGTKLHHSAGVWPLQISDDTEVLEVDPGSRLVLQARAFVIGSARVEITVDPLGDDRCEVTMYEYADSGPGWFMPAALQAPAVRVRNTECLSRLRDLAVNRHHA